MATSGQVQVPVAQRYTIDALGGRAATINGAPTGRVTELDVVRQPARNPILWFVVIALIIGVLFWIFRPTMVLSTNQTTGQTQLDWGKLVLWSLGIALVLAFFYYLGTRSGMGGLF